MDCRDLGQVFFEHEGRYHIRRRINRNEALDSKPDSRHRSGRSPG
jgi:hypothetical protein